MRRDTVSRSPGWTGTCCVAKADRRIALPVPPQMLGLQIQTTTHSWGQRRGEMTFYKHLVAEINFRSCTSNCFHSALLVTGACLFLQHLQQALSICILNPWYSSPSKFPPQVPIQFRQNSFTAIKQHNYKNMKQYLTTRSLRNQFNM